MEKIGKIQLRGDEDSMMDIAYTIVYPFALRAAILLNVPMIIHSAGPGAALSAQEICSQLVPNPKDLRTSSENLEKFLEVLSSYGVFKVSTVNEIDSTNISVKKYGLTSSSQDLTRDEIAGGLLVLGAPEIVEIWPRLHECVLRPEEILFENVYGKGLYQYLKEDAPKLAEFHVNLMSKQSAIQLEALLEHYDEEFKTLTGKMVDVGGSQGAVAATIASRYPNIHSVVNFDLPDVVSGARVLRGVEHVGGSFLDFVPEGDILLMKFVLSNWGEEEATKILRNCYNALPAQGKVIIVDMVNIDSADNETKWRIAVQDLLTNVVFRGKIRMLEQLRSVAKAAGFAHLLVVKTVGAMVIIEASKMLA